MDAMRNAMRELLKNAKTNAFENPAHPCPWCEQSIYSSESDVAETTEFIKKIDFDHFHVFGNLGLLF